MVQSSSTLSSTSEEEKMQKETFSFCEKQFILKKLCILLTSKCFELLSGNLSKSRSAQPGTCIAFIPFSFCSFFPRRQIRKEHASSPELPSMQAAILVPIYYTALCLEATGTDMQQVSRFGNACVAVWVGRTITLQGCCGEHTAHNKSNTRHSS